MARQVGFTQRCREVQALIQSVDPHAKLIPQRILISPPVDESLREVRLNQHERQAKTRVVPRKLVIPLSPCRVRRRPRRVASRPLLPAFVSNSRSASLTLSL